MMPDQAWHTDASRLKRLVPRWERIFLPIVPPLSRESRATLHVKGLAFKAWCNGKILEKTHQGFPIPLESQKPWENEILLYGILSGAWIESTNAGSVPVMNLKPPDSDPVLAAGDALLSFVVDQGPDTGDCFSFFDPVSMTFRMPSWRWDTGICLEALARLAMVSGQKKYQHAVSLIAKRLLAVQVTDPLCWGGFPEASDLHMTGKKEPTLPQWVVPFNGAFIGAGLLAASSVDEPLAAPCRAAARMGYYLMVERGITGQGFLKGYYHVKDRQWRYHGQINDSGIFPRLAGLLDKTGEPVETEDMLAYSRAMASFLQPRGHVGRARWLPGKDTYPAGTPLFPEWKTHPDQIPAKIFARGQAWYLLGAVGAWQLTADKHLGRSIKAVVEYLISCQDKSGLWHHDIGQPGQGLDVKGSAVVLWALLEAKPTFLVIGGDKPKLRTAVERAWKALVENQQQHLAGPLPGALGDTGREGAIIYFRDRPMYTAYGSAAFIIAGCLMKQNYQANDSFKRDKL